MTINDYHQEAMSLAADAIAQRSANRPSREIFERAFSLELKAALLHSESSGSEPTRGILFRSAASLAIDAEQFDEAVRVIGMGLSGSPPRSLTNELLATLETATFRRHLRLQGVRLSSRELLFSLAGEGVGEGTIEDNDFLPRVSSVTRMIERTAQRLAGQEFVERRRPKLANDFRTYLEAPIAASFAVKIRVGQRDAQRQFQFNQDDVVGEFVDCLKVFGNDGAAGLVERIPQSHYLVNFLSQLRQLKPDGKRIKQVAFEGGGSPSIDDIYLYDMPAEMFNIPVASDDLPETHELRGFLHGAKTSSRQTKRSTITLETEDGSTKTVSVPRGMMNDIVRPLWDFEVVVTATRRGKIWTLQDICPAEDGDEN